MSESGGEGFMGRMANLFKKKEIAQDRAVKADGNLLGRLDQANQGKRELSEQQIEAIRRQI